MYQICLIRQSLNVSYVSLRGRLQRALDYLMLLSCKYPK